MDLIDRYVHEVGEHLPRRLRDDVEAELRSLLSDAVEDRAREAGGDADPQTVKRVLREFGRPRDVAERYAPPAQYLIGPRLFVPFKITVFVMAGIFGAAAVVASVLGTLRAAGVLPAGSAPDGPFGTVASVLHGAIFNFGLLALVFAAVERVMLGREAGAPEREWDPESLPPVRDPDRISPGSLVFAIYAIVACVVIFNFFPRWIGFHAFSNGEWRSLSMLLPEFSRHLPMLNAWWALAFVLDLAVLRSGRWTRATRWGQLLLGLAGAAAIGVIVAGPPVFVLDPAVKALLGIPLLIALIRSGLRLVRLLRR